MPPSGAGALDDLTIDTVVARFDENGDPWADIGEDPQSISALLQIANLHLPMVFGEFFAGAGLVAVRALECAVDIRDWRTIAAQANS